MKFSLWIWRGSWWKKWIQQL